MHVSFGTCCGSILSLVQFLFFLFQTHYHIIIIHYNAKKQRKIKIEPNKNVTAVFRNMRTLLKSTVSRSTFFAAVNHNNYGDS